MTKPAFSEVIKVKDGVFYHLPYHEARMNRTTRHFFGQEIRCPLTPEMVPADLRSGLVKCRIVYSDRVLSVEFAPYAFRSIKNVAIVFDNEIDYFYKSTDRSRLNALLERSGGDEIVIVKNGFVTDASVANLVLESESGLYTPDTCLLPGTKREYLLRDGVIAERPVKLEDLRQATKIHLINAMTDLGDCVFTFRDCLVLSP